MEFPMVIRKKKTLRFPDTHARSKQRKTPWEYCETCGHHETRLHMRRAMGWSPSRPFWAVTVEAHCHCCRYSLAATSVSGKAARRPQGASVTRPWVTGATARRTRGRRARAERSSLRLSEAPYPLQQLRFDVVGHRACQPPKHSISHKDTQHACGAPSGCAAA